MLRNTSAKTYYNSIVRIVFVLAFIKLLINEESFGRSFSFSFPARYFDRNLKCLFEKLANFLYCTLPFLNVMKVRRFKTH